MSNKLLRGDFVIFDDMKGLTGKGIITKIQHTSSCYRHCFFSIMVDDGDGYGMGDVTMVGAHIRVVEEINVFDLIKENVK